MSFDFLSGLIGALIGSIVPAAALFVQVMINKNNLSVQHITDKRVDWIYALRDELSNYISSVFYFMQNDKSPNFYDSTESIKIIQRINKSFVKIRLLLNIDGKNDKEISDILHKIQVNTYQQSSKFDINDFSKYIEDLTLKSQIYLKLEWEKVKLEAKSTKEKKQEKELSKKENELKCIQEKLINDNSTHILL